MSAAATKESITIQNVVVSSGVGQELSLQSLAMDLAGSDYDPDRFPGISLQIDETGATALIFRSGKLVCTGATSVADAEAAVDIVRERLTDLGVDAEPQPTTVQNIVSSADLGSDLNLNAIAIGLGLEVVEYEPEQFPGLVYRVDDPDVVLLLFGSGKVVVTGARRVEDAANSLEAVREELDTLGLLD